MIWLIIPYDYQEECLGSIEQAVAKGQSKFLVEMAPSLGKTIVAAFYVKRIWEEAAAQGNPREPILYLCNQREALIQALAVFRLVLGREFTHGFLFQGSWSRWRQVDVRFATFQTMMKWRKAYGRNGFDHVIVDEVHHAPAPTFCSTVKYFRPKTMLGLTATLERTDGLEVQTLFDNHKPVFSLGLPKALARGLVSDIEYRIMTDEIQRAGAFDSEYGTLSIRMLNRTIFVPLRDEKIVEIIQRKMIKFAKPRVLIFCASIRHADAMAALLPGAVSIHSRSKNNAANIKAFREGKISIVISVDKFNEGFDVPELNIIVFLRSTASKMLFLQQLGRGIRLASGVVLVLDFVANCERIEMIEELRNEIERAKSALRQRIDYGLDLKRRIGLLTLKVDGGEFEERAWAGSLLGLIKHARSGGQAVAQPVGRSRPSIDKGDIIVRLAARTKELGRPPKFREIDRDPSWPSAYDIRDAFDAADWNGVLAEAGLARQPISRRANTPAGRRIAIEELHSKARSLGRSPTADEVDADPSMASSAFYRTIHNTTSWNVVLKAQGMPLVKRTSCDVQELTRDLLAKAEALGRPPMVKEANADPNMACVAAYLTTFGMRWSEIIIHVGLSPRSRYTTAILAEKMIAKATALGRIPTTIEVDKDPDMPSPITYKKVYATDWKGVLAAIFGNDGDFESN